MARAKERAFGTMPEEMQKGPIDPRNYNHRAEKHCADRSAKRGGEHPVITRASAEFLLWQEYFDRYLGGRPWAFQALLDGKIESMTLPEEKPQWFDPSFVPMTGWRPAIARKPEDGDMRKRVGALLAAFADDLRMGKFKPENAQPAQVVKPGHAERVAADLAERQRRREQAAAP